MDLRATRARIDTRNFIHNLLYFRSLISPQTKLCLTVKGNAYGHGLITMSHIASPYIDSVAVATIDEAIQLRNANISLDIYVLSMHSREEIPALCEYNVIPIISHGAFIAKYQQAAIQMQRILPVHIKVDTGMGRAGVMPHKVVSLATEIAKQSHVCLDGLCTHFASADGTTDTDKTDTERQLAVFQSVLDTCKRQNISYACAHAANSAACIRYPKSHYDMVRIGIGAYGYAGNTKPVMNFTTKISIAKRIPAGHKVSYGGTWQATRDTLIAVLPVGYADGYSRLLSNTGTVLINNILVPIIGRICMDQIVVDITDLGICEKDALGKQALLFGDSPSLNATTIADTCNTISYEVLTAIAQRVPRDYIG